MGKSKNDARYSSPVDLYRREIGKQDYKKSKAELKEAKLKSQKKQTAAEVFKELVILFSFVIVVLGLVFLFLYLYLEKKDDLSVKPL